MKISFDVNHLPEKPTLVLAYKNGSRIGGLAPENIIVKGSMVNPDEISFRVRKHLNERKIEYWDQIVDFKLVWYKETNSWFEMKAATDESNETIKQISCTHLGYAELSQIKIYTTEINTENDIAREEYVIPTVLYSKEHPEASLLHRVMEKAPHYEIVHVDDTIAKLQRTFTFDDISIQDVFKQISEEIGCLFDIRVFTDSNGKIRRTVSVYDLESNCRACGHRGEFTLVCPECGSKDIDEGYGEDTTIFISADELAESIQFETQTDLVKNCFKLVGGDDLMTATIRNCNPNGMDYIWYISDDMKKDMSKELVDKLKEYDALLGVYEDNEIAGINQSLIDEYNRLIEKYRVYDSSLEKIMYPMQGYTALMNAYYDTIDFESLLTSSLMPNTEMADTDAKKQALLLTKENISPVATENTDNVSLSTANNIVLSAAKVIVDSRCQVKVNQSELNGLVWTGNFTVTDYSDEEDTAMSEMIEVEINDDYEQFIKQKLNKAIKDEEKKDYSLTGLFKMEIDEFKNELKKYCLNRLTSFRAACQECINILVEQGVSDGSLWEAEEKDLYNSLYVPYSEKLNAIDDELMMRESEISLIVGRYNIDGELIEHGVQSSIDEVRFQIQKELDYQTFLGDELWIEFCSFRRDDKYSNENYISDGLNNAELFRRAQEFYKIARNEIFKSAELQHCIATTLRNLLMTPEFHELLDMFETGNWIRISVDDRIYKLRLLEYEIDFDNPDTIAVDFSDVFKTVGGEIDQRAIMDKIISMSSSYDGVKRQASQGAESNAVVKNWRTNGLDVSNTKIVSSSNQTQTWDSTGMLFRSYDPIMEEYSSEQLKIINSTMAVTNDAWRTTKTAIGKIYYRDAESGELTSTYGVNGETLVGKVIVGEKLGIYNETGKLKFDQDGFSVSNDKNSVIINPSNHSIFNIKNSTGNILSFDEDGELIVVGNITAKSLTLLNNEMSGSPDVVGLSDVAISGRYDDLLDKPTLSTVASTGSYDDLLNKPNHLTAPTNTGSTNQYLRKTASGSQWTSAETSISSSGSTPVSGSAVYSYAFAKNQGSANANRIVYISEDGSVSMMTIATLKSLLGI